MRAREALGEQQLDLVPGLLRGRGHQLVGVPGFQVRGQHQYRPHVQPAVGQRHEDRRVLPGNARRRDVPVGRVLGEVQLAEAVGVHRVVAGRPEELALVDLGDAREQDRGDAAIALDRYRAGEQHRGDHAACGHDATTCQRAAGGQGGASGQNRAPCQRATRGQR